MPFNPADPVLGSTILGQTVLGVPSATVPVVDQFFPEYDPSRIIPVRSPTPRQPFKLPTLIRKKKTNRRDAIAIAAALMLRGGSRSKPTTEALDPGQVLIDIPDIRQNWDYDCGAAALRACATYFGMPGIEEIYMNDLGTSPTDGTSTVAILRVARQLGLCADVREKMEIDSLQRTLSNGCLVVCPIQADDPNSEEGGHYVVACGYNAADGTLTLQDPLRGRVTIAEADFVRRWHDRGADGREYVRYGIGIWK